MYAFFLRLMFDFYMVIYLLLLFFLGPRLDMVMRRVRQPAEALMKLAVEQQRTTLEREYEADAAPLDCRTRSKQCYPK